MTVVMIPKEGKDLTRAKSWRPIVLMSCLLKLMDKVVANMIQGEDQLLHPGQYGSTKGREVMDMAIQAASEAHLGQKTGNQVA